MCAAAAEVREAAGAAVGGRARGSMEELSSVGEQVFAAECILSKRLRKVRAARPTPARPAPANPGSRASSLPAGQAGVPGQVARLVLQVSPQQCGSCLPTGVPRPGLGGEGGPSAAASGWGSSAYSAGSSRDPRGLLRLCGDGAPRLRRAALCFQAQEVRGQAASPGNPLGSLPSPASAPWASFPSARSASLLRGALLPRPFVACAPPQPSPRTRAPLLVSIFPPL